MRLFFLFVFLVSHLNAMGQLLILNPDALVFPYENDTATELQILVFNASDNTVEFNWRLELDDFYKGFVKTNVSDINIEYIPSIYSNCGLNMPNIIASKDTVVIKLGIRIDIIPDGYQDKDAELSLALLDHPDCENLLTNIDLKVIEPNAILDFSFEDSFVVYPNPAHDRLKFVNYSEIGFLNFTIYDHQGRIIKSGELGQDFIRLEDIPIGLYHIEFSKNNAKVIRRFIKTRL